MKKAWVIFVVVTVFVATYAIVDWLTQSSAYVIERATPTSSTSTTVTVAPPRHTGETAETSPVSPSIDATTIPQPTTPSEPMVSVPVIPPSPPTKLYQPDTGLALDIMELPIDSRWPVRPPDAVSAFWNPEPLKVMDDDVLYAPGSNSSDLSVIAAHTGTSDPDIAFNRLYDWQNAQFAVQLSDEIWVQTQASGNDWLVYRVVNRIVVPKDEIAKSTDVWGEAPKPNHLLLIGCRQIAAGAPSTENFVLEFVFERVDSRPS